MDDKTRYDYKRKKYVPMKPKQGFLVAAVRKFNIDLSNAKHNNPVLEKALKFVKSCHETIFSNG